MNDPEQDDLFADAQPGVAPQAKQKPREPGKRARRFQCIIEWTHPNRGPQRHKLPALGTSIRRAANAALSDFFNKTKLHPERRAAHAHLTIELTREKGT